MRSRSKYSFNPVKSSCNGLMPESLADLGMAKRSGRTPQTIHMTNHRQAGQHVRRADSPPGEHRKQQIDASRNIECPSFCLLHVEYRTRTSALHGQAKLAPWLFQANALVPEWPDKKLAAGIEASVPGSTSYHSPCCRSTVVTLP